MKDLLRCPVSQLEQSTITLKSLLNKNTKSFEKIIKRDPETEKTEYGKFMKKFLAATKDTINEHEKKNVEINKLYQEVCDWYFIVIPKNVKKQEEKKKDNEPKNCKECKQPLKKTKQDDGPK